MNLRISTRLFFSLSLLFNCTLNANNHFSDEELDKDFLLDASGKLALISETGLLFTFGMVLLNFKFPPREFFCPTGSFADNNCSAPCHINNDPDENCPNCTKAKCHDLKNHSKITANPVPQHIYQDSWTKGNFIAMWVLTAVFSASISYPIYCMCKKQ